MSYIRPGQVAAQAKRDEQKKWATWEEQDRANNEAKRLAREYERIDGIERLKALIARSESRCIWAVNTLEYIMGTPAHITLTHRQWKSLEKCEKLDAAYRAQGIPWPDAKPGMKGSPRIRLHEKRAARPDWMKDPSVLPKSPPKRRPSDG